MVSGRHIKDNKNGKQLNFSFSKIWWASKYSLLAIGNDCVARSYRFSVPLTCTRAIIRQKVYSAHASFFCLPVPNNLRVRFIPMTTQPGSRLYLTIERFRDRQTTNTNTCGWAVFLHVDFRFRDGHTDKTNTNTNTTSSAGWNLQIEATQGPEATQPYSTCVQAHSRSLRIHFTAEFAPFFHSRKVNS